MNDKELIQVINKAVEDIGEVIDGSRTVLGCCECRLMLQKIQDYLAGAIEDRMVE